MNTMTLAEAMDFLAKNCPFVFKPISEEFDRLIAKSSELNDKVDSTQSIVNDLVIQNMGVK